MSRKLGHISCKSIVAIMCVTCIRLMKFTLNLNIFVKRKGFFLDHHVTLLDTRRHKGEVTNGAVKRLISIVNHSVHINRMYFKGPPAQC